MKRIQIALLLTVLVFCGLVIYQNLGYLSAPASLQLDLWVTAPFYTDRIINAQLILGAFFAGLLISYFISLSFRFKSNQTIKGLNTTLDSQMETITGLKNELTKFQAPTPQQNPRQSEVSAENT